MMDHESQMPKNPICDQDIQRLIEESHRAARGPLTGQRDTLGHLAQSLLHEGTIDRDDLVQSLGPRPKELAWRRKLTHILATPNVRGTAADLARRGAPGPESFSGKGGRSSEWIPGSTGPTFRS
jgi:hypothetical protein